MNGGKPVVTVGAHPPGTPKDEGCARTREQGWRSSQRKAAG